MLDYSKSGILSDHTHFHMLLVYRNQKSLPTLEMTYFCKREKSIKRALLLHVRHKTRCFRIYYYLTCCCS